ncbi:hypothetical protein BJX68DRAFT_140085 [Aspergillus pseudodeflectus]|uniref:Uncharacterized protein n=1 Tax=Aspergillus pseudodeflectus TaxID=176178 RepID=A0ABR4L2U2_9EURO
MALYQQSPASENRELSYCLKYQTASISKIKYKDKLLIFRNKGRIGCEEVLLSQQTQRRIPQGRFVAPQLQIQDFLQDFRVPWMTRLLIIPKVLLMLARSSLITHAHCTTRLQRSLRNRDDSPNPIINSLPAKAQDVIPSSFPPPFPRVQRSLKDRT